MFRCTDCRQEYNTKPEYCDCGNNVFEEIIEQKEQLPQTPAMPQPQSFQGKTETSKIQESSKKNSQPLTPQDIFSWLIFAVCIILSILALLFLGNENPDKVQKKETKTVKTQQTKTQNVPSIDKLWQNSIKNEVQAPPIQQETLQQEEIPPKPSAIVKQQAINTATAPKKIQPAKVAQQVIKLPQPAKTVTTQPKPPKSTTTAPTAAKQQPAAKTVNTEALKQELYQYKVALRNKIASNINFATVSGDGSCVVSFKVDASGNLTSRSFSKQSENDSLNDAVYAAMMNTPSYKSPPDSYKQETLRLSVKMYGGTFEVNLY